MKWVTAVFVLTLALVGMFFGLGMDEHIRGNEETYSKQKYAVILPGTTQHEHYLCGTGFKNCEPVYDCEYSYQYSEGRDYVIQNSSLKNPTPCSNTYQAGAKIQIWLNPDNPAAHILTDPEDIETAIWARAIGIISGIIGFAALGWMINRIVLDAYLRHHPGRLHTEGPENDS